MFEHVFQQFGQLSPITAKRAAKWPCASFLTPIVFQHWWTLRNDLTRWCRELTIWPKRNWQARDRVTTSLRMKH